MKRLEKTSPTDTLPLRQVFAIIAIAVSLAWLAASVGCTGPVVPHPTLDAQASWDGNVQNSGYIGSVPGGGGIITPRAKAKYDGLVAAYGATELPPVKVGDGLQGWTNGTWYIDAEHLAAFRLFNRFRKEGKP